MTTTANRDANRTANEAGEVKLLDAALETARGMRGVAQGKPADFATRSDARSFIGIARLLELMAEEVKRQRSLAQQRGDALARIADLRIRGGTRLVEAGRWHDIAAELREIADETLAAEASAQQRPPTPSAAGI